jgi:hypothetical protein
MPYSIDLEPHGYYIVGNRVFLNKTEAVYEASVTKQDLRWNFHDDCWGAVNWTKCPTDDLRSLYKQRAQQIRDQYDHIVLMFSGGMDSWTMLHSFFSNNIHVDEVWTNWPLAQLKWNTVTPTNFSEVNIISEFKYAVLPVLEHIKKTYPATKITINDYSKELEKEYTHKIFMSSNNWQTPTTTFRNGGTSTIFENTLSKEKRVACIHGLEKPRLTLQDNKLYGFFIDVYSGTNSNIAHNNEFFYTSRDFPDVTIAQVHAIKDYLLENNGMLHVRKTNPGRNEWNEVFRSACYPDYGADTFQVGKSLGSKIKLSDNWVSAYNKKYIEGWQWTLGQYYDSIDDKFLRFDKTDSEILGLESIKSKLYLIDDNFVCPGVNFNVAGFA